MNKTISINIKGFVFNLEEDAYQILQDYLKKLRNLFAKQEGRDEILDDIETRIAELFNEMLDENKQAITTADVDQVIAVLGSPEDFDSGNEEDYEPAQEPRSTRSDVKKLYRDEEGGMIGGVCSGLAYYLNWDPLWIRILFLLFLFSGFSVLVYIILYLIVPEAKTTSEKLHMKGEHINIENIKKKVSESFEETKESLKRATDEVKSGSTSLGRVIRNILDLFVKFFGLLGKLITKFFGVFLLLGGVLLLVMLITGLVTADSFFFHETNMNFDQMELLFLHGSGSVQMAIIGASLVIFSLLFIFLYHGIRILFNTPNKIKGVSYASAALFVIGVILLTVVGISNAKNHTTHETVTSAIEIPDMQGDTLYIAVAEDPYFHENIKYHNSEFPDLVKFVDDRVVLGFNVEVNLYEGKGSEFKIEEEREASGASLKDALNNIEDIEYKYAWDGDTLVLDPNTSISADNKFHGQEVDIDIYVPNGKVVQFMSGADRLDIPGWNGEYLEEYLTVRKRRIVRWSERLRDLDHYDPDSELEGLEEGLEDLQELEDTIRRKSGWDVESGIEEI